MLVCVVKSFHVLFVLFVLLGGLVCHHVVVLGGCCRCLVGVCVVMCVCFMFRLWRLFHVSFFVGVSFTSLIVSLVFMSLCVVDCFICRFVVLRRWVLGLV